MASMTQSQHPRRALTHRVGRCSAAQVEQDFGPTERLDIEEQPVRLTLIT